MRAMLFIISLFYFSQLQSQSFIASQLSPSPYSTSFNKHAFDSTTQKKWFITRFAALSTSYSFYKGGNAVVVAAPIGLQLNRRLNDNLYAFANASIAPAYVNLNHPFFVTGNKLNTQGSFQSNNFNVYSQAAVGLMYVSPSKTFFISGSFGVERNNYPVYYDNGNNNPSNYIRPIHN